MPNQVHQYGILLGARALDANAALDENDPKSANKKKGGKFQGTGNSMDLLKKFRYNFHYWLKNCY